MLFWSLRSSIVYGPGTGFFSWPVACLHPSKEGWNGVIFFLVEAKKYSLAIIHQFQARNQNTCGKSVGYVVFLTDAVKTLSSPWGAIFPWDTSQTYSFSLKDLGLRTCGLESKVLAPEAGRRKCSPNSYWKQDYVLGRWDNPKPQICFKSLPSLSAACIHLFCLFFFHQTFVEWRCGFIPWWLLQVLCEQKQQWLITLEL